MSSPCRCEWPISMTKATSLNALARPEIQTLNAYVPASFQNGLTRLNANEAPWTSSADNSNRRLNHYPPARPTELTELLATHYGVPPDHLFVTRGSSEGIDLLIRCFCRPGVDEIVICPPTFGMYQVYADIQAAAIKSIPLISENHDRLPVDAILSGWTGTSRLVFVTTPNNPTGGLMDVADIRRLAESLAGRGIVVVDAAYIEFANPAPTMELLSLDNVAILRTMSKAYGLAGARCGALIGAPALIDLVSRVMPPYSMPTPSIEAALTALVKESFDVMPERIAGLIVERDRMHKQLLKYKNVVKVWQSAANFLLVQFKHPEKVMHVAEQAGYLLRDFSKSSFTKDCIRITIGTNDDNARLLSVIAMIDAEEETP